jgi:hypothetical protein
LIHGLTFELSSTSTASCASVSPALVLRKPNKFRSLPGILLLGLADSLMLAIPSVSVGVVVNEASVSGPGVANGGSSASRLVYGPGVDIGGVWNNSVLSGLVSVTVDI